MYNISVPIIYTNYIRKRAMLVKNRIQEIRQQRSMTVRHLASLSGLSISTISRIENHSCSPTFSSMIRISNALNMRIWDVFYY